MNIKATYYIVVLIGLLGVSSCKKKANTAPAKKAAIEVSAVRVMQKDIKEYLTFNGVTAYQKKENIRANVTGYISGMRHKIGGKIRDGQVFAYVRTKEQDALRDAVKIDSSLAKFIGPITIKSNATGIISVLNVNRNDYVAEGDVIAVVVQPKSLVVQVNVPFEYKQNVQIGAPCELLLPDGKTMTATITEVLPTIDVQSQAQTFLVDLPEANLPENLNIQVKLLQKESTNAKSIPKTALQTNELLTKYWVMKVVDDSLAIKTMVEPLLKNDSLVQIQSERVQLNDWVITKGAYQMQDSTVVKIQK